MIESKKTKQQLDADKVRSFIAIETNQKLKLLMNLIRKLKNGILELPGRNQAIPI